MMYFVRKTNVDILPDYRYSDLLPYFCSFTGSVISEEEKVRIVQGLERVVEEFNVEHNLYEDSWPIIVTNSEDSICLRINSGKDRYDYNMAEMMLMPLDDHDGCYKKKTTYLVYNAILRDMDARVVRFVNEHLRELLNDWKYFYADCFDDFIDAASYFYEKAHNDNIDATPVSMKIHPDRICFTYYDPRYPSSSRKREFAVIYFTELHNYKGFILP